MLDKSEAKRLVAQVCHSDPVTAKGEYCLTLDELVAFGRAAAAAQQAEIDRLMLEFCPEEMAPEQLANWAAHQRPADPTTQAVCTLLGPKGTEA